MRMHTKVERKKKENKGKITKRGMRGDPAPTSYMTMRACICVSMCIQQLLPEPEKKYGGREAGKRKNREMKYLTQRSISNNLKP